MYILGINAFHADSSACLIKDGNVLSAVEEERFKREKHWAGFPSESIAHCLNNEGISISDVEHVAINMDPKANLLKKIKYAVKKRPELSLVIDRLKNRFEREGVEYELKKAFPNEKFQGEVHHIEHHLSHLCSAYLPSPFDSAVAISVDGFGDFSSTAWGLGEGGELSCDSRVYFPHSLGIFYQAMTQYLGFPKYGDEYKVMGLAPYGKPKYLDHLRDMVRMNSDGTFELCLEFYRHHKEKIEYEWSGGEPKIGDLFDQVEVRNLLGFDFRKNDESLEQSHFDLAHSVQALYEEVFFNILEATHSKYKVSNLALAGGCAMNSVANGKIYRMTPYEKVYVQAAAGDAGGAIGAALYVAGKKLKTENRGVMEHAYFGPDFNEDYLDTLVSEYSSRLNEEMCEPEKVESSTELCHKVATCIANGKVIGWFQGKMEWGPRALGNRSILADPRRGDMKEILNSKIKRRESFRPFAPSILRESVPDWFEEDDDVPFMAQVFQIKEDKRDVIKAVTHVDGSGRLQTVTRESNSLYYKLIETFESITSVPVLLNTSFNENEPVVCKPEEAMNTFLRTKMDVLVLGNWVISRV